MPLNNTDKFIWPARAKRYLRNFKQRYFTPQMRSSPVTLRLLLFLSLPRLFVPDQSVDWLTKTKEDDLRWNLNLPKMNSSTGGEGVDGLNCTTLNARDHSASASAPTDSYLTLALHSTGVGRATE